MQIFKCINDKFNEIHSAVIGYDCNKNIYKYFVYNDIFVLLEKTDKGYQIIKIEGFIKFRGVKFNCEKNLTDKLYFENTFQARDAAKEIVFEKFDELFLDELNNFYKDVKEDDLLVKKLLTKKEEK